MTPFEYLVWDARDCAAYFKETPEYFLRETRHREGHYNTARPSIDVLRDFAYVLLYLANRIDQR